MLFGALARYFPGGAEGCRAFDSDYLSRFDIKNVSMHGIVSWHETMISDCGDIVEGGLL
jgi:hypothetical protein